VPAAEQAVGADRHAVSRRRRERSISLCARAALHMAARGRSTAALCATSKRLRHPVNRSILAKHFQSLTAITREAVFGSADASIRPINLPDDAATMFAGYVGTRYERGKGVLLLAINPGGGGDAYTARIPADEVFYPLLLAFKSSNADPDKAFERVNASFAQIVQTWNLWRILGPTLEAAGLNLDEVAYMNVVPYRTRQDKMPPTSARRVAWDRIAAPTIELLDPRALISLGKKAGSVVDSLCRDDRKRYCVPRTIGDTYISDEARAVLAQINRERGDA
jgi:hypothetical protein